MNGIYVDFEATKTSPPAPAILGILRDMNDSESFEQVVLDDRLWPAVVAAPHLRRATLEETVATLTASGLPIVAWSVFDRDLVRNSPLAAALKQRWDARYVNALTVARTWRTQVHPRFRITRAGKHDAKHTLDQYAELAGHPSMARLRQAHPARWIRHLRAQLASRATYGRVTRQAKRDWRDLLRYNREDCLALRHVYLRATAELTTWRAYRRTTYCVFDESREVCFRVGGASGRLAQLMRKHAATRWALLTAWNPASTPLPARENDARQNALLERLLSSGYRCLRGDGRGDDPSWPAEESVMALDIPERAAVRIGREFGQLAIVAGRTGAPSRLVPCL